MSSNNVQDAIDELYGVARLSDRMDELEDELNDKIDDYWKTVYPVGSIYTSIDSTNPSQTFGGTWVSYGSGKTLVGVDTNDTSFDTVEETGGGKTTSYTPAGSVGNTTLTTEQIPSHTHDYVKGTGIAGTTLSISQIPVHRHTVRLWGYTGGSGGGYAQWATNNGAGTGNASYGVRLHYTSGSYGGWQSSAFNKVAQSGWGDQYGITDTAGTGGSHSHTLNTSTVASANTGGGKAHNHEFTGTAASISTVQPYITVYMWKRTA